MSDNIVIDHEKEAILAHFVKVFDHLREWPMALYGVGPNTHYLLKRVQGFNIVGLMDQENTGREMFGMPVLSVEQVSQSVKSIVIVARAAVVQIIYLRIASLAASHGVAIYDLGGNCLSATRPVLASYPRGNYANDEAELRRVIDEADIISFDIFATLLTRKVLRLDNVFDLIEQSLPSRLGVALPFKANRILAEQLANERCQAPTIDCIYDELAQLLGITVCQRQALLEEEIAAEFRLLTPRNKMVQIFNDALAKGKTVYLISDMYFGKVVLTRILEANGIVGYKDLLVSCELGITKRSGDMFQHFLRVEPVGSHLHVGDDLVADVEVPRCLGIRAFHVMSGYEMLVHSPLNHLLACVVTSSDALALGLFAARAFNDPFALHETEGRLSVTSAFDLGYLAYGAMLSGFIRWVLEIVSGQTSTKILFGARDGYLVEKLYRRIVETFDVKDAPEGIYFLTSRRAATVASLQCRQDIVALLNGIAGSPSYGEILETRFGVVGDPANSRYGKRLQREDTADMMEFVLEFEQRILENAEAERNAYRKYVESIGIVAEEKLYFFDLITSGTIPHFLERLLGAAPVCLCFIVSLPVKHPFAVEPCCYLGESTPYQKSWKFFASHYVTESILTAPFPEFKRMGEDGVPVYGHGDDSHKHFEKVKVTQDGIESFFAEFLGLVSRADFAPITIALADGMNGILCSEYCLIDDDLKSGHLVNDRYTFSSAMNPWCTIGTSD